MIRVAIESPELYAELAPVFDGSSGIVPVHDGQTADVTIVAGRDAPAADGGAMIIAAGEAAVDWNPRSGISAVLPRSAGTPQWIAAIHAVAAGLLVIHPDQVHPPPRDESPWLEGLTPRETSVLGMLAAGLGNKIIAYRLGISEHTVKFHVASILSKLGASTRTEAVSIGVRNGLVTL